MDWTISYEPNGAYGSMVPSKFHKCVFVSQQPSQFRNPGYDFSSWYSSPSCKDSELIKFPLYFEESIVIYPKWTLNIPSGQCLVVYHLDPEVGHIESHLQLIGDSDNQVSFYLPRPPKHEKSDGSKFFAWALDESNPLYYNYYQAFPVYDWKVNKSGFVNIYPHYTKEY